MSNCSREETLKRQLSPEKVRFLSKHGLHLEKHETWGREKGNEFPFRFARHSFVLKSDMLGLVFRAYSLCAAKLKYYRDNWAKYEPYAYDLDRGFVPTELWNMEFLRHRPSGKFIDLRQLQAITDIEVFREFCRRLEVLEPR